MAKQPVTVADYIKQQIALSAKSQKDIAKEAGYTMVNNLSMIKEGVTKLPINRVKPMAIALGVDPAHLLQLVMREYMPETWAVIEEVIAAQAGRVLSKDDKALLDTYHARSKSLPLVEDDAGRRAEFAELVDQWLTAEVKDRESAVRASDGVRGPKSKAKVT